MDSTPARATAAADRTAAVRPRRPWLRAAGWAASVAILAATTALLRDRMGAVGDAGGLPGVVPSSVAVVTYVIANLLLADTWWRVVALAGSSIGRGDAIWVWALSQLARYTLGAAQVGGRAVIGRRYGLTATAGAVTTLVEIGWQTAITALLVLATLPWWLPSSDDLRWLAVVGIVPAGALVVGLVAPRTLLRLVASALDLGPLARLTGGRAVDVAERVRLDRGHAAAFTLRFALNTALRLVAFGALFLAVGGDLPTTGLLALGAYAAGQLVGRIAVFAPGGIGPREGVTALLLAPALGGGPALVLVAATRLLEVVGELAFFGIARFVRGRGARRAGSGR
ncbi:MAG: lysylphosphatidylglycerol synthase domain-containing protein [Egibacteraceae bacterium]